MNKKNPMDAIKGLMSSGKQNFIIIPVVGMIFNGYF